MGNDWTKPSTILPVIGLVVGGLIAWGALKNEVSSLSKSFVEEKTDVAANFSDVHAQRRNQWRVIEKNRDGIKDNQAEGRVINQKLKNIDEKVDDLKTGQERMFRVLEGLKK
jgi:hypothetical protein|tara:strand:+ start:2266 stop:2601 length:336 start_codon:yes stop_codon:yes gene_type:complete